MENKNTLKEQDYHSLDERNIEDLDKALTWLGFNLNKSYLDTLSQYPIIQPQNSLLDQTTEKCLRFIHIDHVVLKKGEDTFQKLETVYRATMSFRCNMAFIIDAPSNSSPVDIYIGVQNSDAELGDGRANLTTSFKALKNGLQSNFPGIRMHDIDSSNDLPELLNSVFGSSAKNITTVSCIPSIRDKSKTENKAFIQGIEKFIETMRGNSYTAIFIAQPVSSVELNNITDGYESIYSMISSFEKAAWSYNESKSNSVMNTITKGLSTAITEGTTHTQSHVKTKGIFASVNGGMNSQNSLTQGTNDGINSKSTVGRIASGLSAGTAVASLLFPAVAPLASAVSVIAGMGAGAASSSSTGTSNTVSNAISKLLGITGGGSLSSSEGISDSETESNTQTKSESESNGTTKTQTLGRTLQLEFTNKKIKNILKKIDKQIARIEDSRDYGAYSTCAYFISSRSDVSLLAANSYRSLMMGDGSELENSTINIWDSALNKQIVDVMKEYLIRFEHPVFAVNSPENASENTFLPVTAGTIISGKELSQQISFPLSSVNGLPVIECASFGREVNTYEISNDSEKTISLGHTYHMNKEETDFNVDLCLNSLASHTFITGSTGTGKSNTVYQLLSKVRNEGVHFLVIEPAKGEYKECLGSEVHVLGTNDNETELLYINPFSFPDSIHVLEHIDRLVEILNACWPMYAAMPAVLKDSIERVYINRGWNLHNSKCCVNGIGRFPTFSDLLTTLPEVMNESSYSADTKSDYTGALVTRVKSLTNGLNGQILCSGLETDNKTLFEEDTIIDLSRIGSTETRSFFMGILVMKLQEYHMNQKNKMNVGLKHLTVLEEAHNLLRRTSFSQMQESANLQGKSVEMITNSIAEMRTYGEGFVIVDQAPGLLDEAVIRNTNTKIILRLPDHDDRVTVGKSAALNEQQIDEIAKLPRGVAVVYQNNWVEAVLCHFDKFDNPKPYKKPYCKIVFPQNLFCKYVFRPSRFTSLKSEDVDSILAWVESSKYARETKRIMAKALKNMELSEREKHLIAYNIFEGKTVAKILAGAVTEKDGITKADNFIRANTDIGDDKIIEMIRLMIIQVIIEQSSESELSRRYIEYSGNLQ